MSSRIVSLAQVVCLGVAFALPLSLPVNAVNVSASVADNGVVTVKSAYPMQETITRLKADIADKGITFFLAVDQSKLAGDAGITLRPSTLLIFGNPALGSHFITARPEAGLDWPVRLLVHEDKDGQVWANYSDFSWIARRHGITDRSAEFAKATEVISSITSTIVAK